MKVYRFLYSLGLGLLAVNATHTQQGRPVRGVRAANIQPGSPEARLVEEQRSAESERLAEDMKFDGSLEAALANPAKWAYQFVTIYELPHLDRTYTDEKIKKMITNVEKALGEISAANFNTAEMNAIVLNLKKRKASARLVNNFNKLIIEPIIKTIDEAQKKRAAAAEKKAKEARKAKAIADEAAEKVRLAKAKAERTRLAKEAAEASAKTEAEAKLLREAAEKAEAERLAAEENAKKLADAADAAALAATKAGKEVVEALRKHLTRSSAESQPLLLTYDKESVDKEEAAKNSALAAGVSAEYEKALSALDTGAFGSFTAEELEKIEKERKQAEATAAQLAEARQAVDLGKKSQETTTNILGGGKVLAYGRLERAVDAYLRAQKSVSGQLAARDQELLNKVAALKLALLKIPTEEEIKSYGSAVRAKHTLYVNRPLNAVWGQEFPFESYPQDPNDAEQRIADTLINLAAAIENKDAETLWSTTESMQPVSNFTSAELSESARTALDAASKAAASAKEATSGLFSRFPSIWRKSDDRPGPEAYDALIASEQAEPIVTVHTQQPSDSSSGARVISDTSSTSSSALGARASVSTNPSAPLGSAAAKPF